MNLWNRTEKEGDCLMWQGYKDKDGYGTITIKGVPHRTHRLAYILTHLEPLMDLWVLHTCDRPSCINPEHLYAGTQIDNEQDKLRRNRNMNAQKTECKRGHEFTLENTRIDPRGQRVCKSCDAIRTKKYREQR